MTQSFECVLLALSEMRSIGHITAALQMRMIQMDLNPEYIRRECAMYLDDEERMDDVPCGSRHMIEWATRLLEQTQCTK